MFPPSQFASYISYVPDNLHPAIRVQKISIRYIWTFRYLLFYGIILQTVLLKMHIDIWANISLKILYISI